MSGDVGLHEQPIVFYHKGMTEAKKIVLQQKGIKLAYLEINSQKEDGRSARFLYEGRVFNRLKSKNLVPAGVKPAGANPNAPDAVFLYNNAPHN